MRCVSRILEANVRALPVRGSAMQIKKICTRDANPRQTYRKICQRAAAMPLKPGVPPFDTVKLRIKKS
jgi:hypothetical protein